MTTWPLDLRGTAAGSRVYLTDEPQGCDRCYAIDRATIWPRGPGAWESNCLLCEAECERQRKLVLPRPSFRAYGDALERRYHIAADGLHERSARR